MIHRKREHMLEQMDLFLCSTVQKFCRSKYKYLHQRVNGEFDFAANSEKGLIK
jgi:hypothetical protein